MEALRNYSQHAGLPVQSVYQDSRWTSLEGDRLMEFSIEPNSIKGELQADKKFKKWILGEFGEKIDLKSAARFYVESISNIHSVVRSLISNSVDSARALVVETQEKYGEVSGGDMLGLAACAMDKSRETKSVPLLLDWDDIRIELQKRNRKLTNLNRRFVSGATKPSKS